MIDLLGTIIGYFFAVVVGQVAIQIFVDGLWRSIGWTPSIYAERPEYFLPRLVGIIERTLYVASLQLGKPEFIGVWLALKVAGQWKRWGEDAIIGGKKVEGRVFYNIFLIGSALSIAYAICGAQMIKYFDASQWLNLVGLPLVILFGTGILQILANYWVKKANKNTAISQADTAR